MEEGSPQLDERNTVSGKNVRNLLYFKPPRSVQVRDAITSFHETFLNIISERTGLDKVNTRHWISTALHCPHVGIIIIIIILQKLLTQNL